MQSGLPPSHPKIRSTLGRLLPVHHLSQTRGSVLSSSSFSLTTTQEGFLPHNTSLVSISVKKKRTPRPEDFNQVIHKLSSVVKEKQFISECIELKPGSLVSGFVPAHTSQYFLIKLRDSEAPLTLSVKRTKGKVESYFSFTSLRPGPLMYDYRFIGDRFEVFGKYSTFVEPQGCLGVLALSDSRINVSATFGKIKTEFHAFQRHTSKPRELKDIVEADLERYRDNPVLRTQLEEEVKRIMMKRKGDMRQKTQEVRLFSAMSVTDLGSRQALREKRQVQTRERRRELVAAKRDKILQLLHRNEIWQSAYKESQRIETFLTRKQAYEQIWFSLIQFASMTEFLFARFKLLRLSRMRSRLQYIMAFRIQNVYRYRVKVTYKGHKPKLIWAHLHLLLLKSVYAHHVWPQHQHLTFQVIKESCTNASIQKDFNDFLYVISKIQKNWRRKKSQEMGYLEFLGEMWEREVASLVQRFKEKSRKKSRKTAAFTKYLNISPEAKAEALHAFFSHRKSTYLSALRIFKASRERNPLLRKPIFNSLPKPGEMRMMIKTAVESTHKLGKSGAALLREDTVIGEANVI